MADTTANERRAGASGLAGAGGVSSCVAMELPMRPAIPGATIAGRPEDRWIEVGGIRTRYWSVGGGPRVLLLHGMGASVESFLRNVDALAQHFEVDAVDLVGFGRTGKPRGFDYTLHGLARFVHDYLVARGIERTHVVGHSLGGAIGLLVARAWPEKVDRLALVAPAGLGGTLPLVFRVLNVPGLGELGSYPTFFGMRAFFALCLYDRSSVSDDLIREALELARLPGGQRALLDVVRANTALSGLNVELSEAVERAMRERTAPTLLVWGTHDRIHPAPSAEEVAAKWPGARFHSFERCGHAPSLEHPEALNGLLIEWLS
jgi:4,5:9,10-diseco-3-hydroxy-5,9,17-trioxoandrosta-1(10),2-diene-4-oate hydrolase